MHNPWVKRLGRGGFLVVFFLLAFAGVALATHFRYGTLTWRDLGGGDVEFTLTYVERTNYYPSAGTPVTISQGVTYTDEYAMDFGDGTATVKPTMTVTQVDSAGGWFSAKSTFTHHYATNGTFTAFWTGYGRLQASSGHQNNAQQDWNLQTVVNITGSAPPNAPVSSLPPIVDCPKNSVCQFQVAASGGLSNNPLQFRLSTATEAQGAGRHNVSTIFAQPSGATISSSGQYTWDTTGATLAASGDTFYSTQVMIQYQNPGTGAPSSPLDFFIRVIPRTPAELPQPAAGTSDPNVPYNVEPNNPINLDVHFTDPQGKAITIGIIGKPSGATFDPGTPSTDVTGHFSWTPTNGDLGSYVINFTGTDSDGYSCPPISFRITVNRAPVYTAAGTNTSQPIAEQQGLAAVAATDPDGDAISYSLAGGSLPSGITLNANGTFSGIASCTAAGNYTASIRATDAKGAGKNTSLAITVTSTNCAPTFSGPSSSQTINEGQGLTSVLATDPDVDTLTYTIQSGTLPAGITLNTDGSFNGTAAYTAAQTSGGLYSVVIQASDGSLTTTTTLNITVNDTNRPPTFPGGTTSQTINEGDGLSAVLATDPDGDPLTYTIQSGTLPTGITLNSNGTFTGVTNYSGAGAYSVDIQTSDGKGGVAAITLYITVLDVNRPPSFTAAPGNTAQTVAEGGTPTGLVTTDPDTDTVTYSLYSGQLPPDITLNSDGTFSGSISCTAAQSNGGDYTAGILAADGKGGTATTTLTVHVTNINCAPSFPVNPTSQSIPEGQGLSAVPATDPDGDTLTYTLQSGTLPAGITLNTDATFSGTAAYTAAQTSGGSYSVVLKADDGHSGTATITLNITVTDTNRPPTFSGSTTAQSISEGQGLTAVLASDPDSDTLTYTLQSGTLPTTITLNSNGTFTGVADYAAAETSLGAYTGVIQASDGKGGTATITLNITVADTNRPPGFTGAPSNTAQTVAEAATPTGVVATDPDNDTVTYSLYSGQLPVGLTFNSNGTFSGTIDYAAAQTSGGQYTLVIRASDGRGGIATTTLTITVTDNNRAPGFPGSTTSQAISEGQGLTAVTATDPDGDTLTYTLLSGTLPSTITLGTDGTFSSTADYGAAEASNGDYSVVIQAADGKGGTATITLHITVADTNRPPSFTGAPGNTAQTLAEGATPGDVVATDPDNDSVTYSLYSGQLPPTITFNPSGTFSGTISCMAAQSNGGIYTVGIQAADGRGGTKNTTLTITVTNINCLPSFSAGSSMSQTINEGEGLSAVMATDPDGNVLTYTLQSGTLPAGITLNTDGTFSGTAAYTAAQTNNGQYSVVLKADDGHAGTITITLNITVNDVNRAPTFASSTVSQTIYENQGLSALLATDLDGDTLTYTLPTGSLPSNITLNANGTFSGAADYGAAEVNQGDYTVDIKATDGRGGQALTTLNITVQDVNRPPLFTSDPGNTAQTVAEGATPAPLVATDPDTDIDTVTYSLYAGTLPAGLTLNSDGTFQGTITYTAASGGPYTMTIEARDGRGGVAYTTLVLTVTNTDTTPTLAVIPPQQSAEAASVTLQLYGSDVDGDLVTYGVSGLPAGLTLDPVTGRIAGTIPYTGAEHGTPPGTYSVTAVVYDPAGQTGTRTFLWTITNVDTTPTLAAIPPQTTREGDMLTLTPVAGDVDGDVLTWSATGLPPGVAINPTTGRFTNPLPVDISGVYHTTITVTDNTPGGPSGDSASRTFTWTVTPQLLAANSRIYGTARTDSGRAGSGLSVTLKNSQGAIVATTTTDDQGTYSFDHLVAGGYTVLLTWGQSPVSQSTSLAAAAVAQVDFTLISGARLSLLADPATIVGDGRSTSAMQATVVTQSGSPLAGVSVGFSTTAGTLSGSSATSNASGLATVNLTAPLLGGTAARTETAKAAVYDPQRGISAEASVRITFLPASVQGIITDGTTGRPVAGAVVEVAEDFDGDGTIDFTASVTTGPDGRYTFLVPRGDWSYHITVSTPVVVNGKTVMVKSHQTGLVGQLKGVGEKITAQRTIAGAILATTPTGDPQSVSNILKLGEKMVGSIRTATGQPVSATVTVNPDGTYEVKNIGAGEYRLTFDVVSPSGQHLVGASVRVRVSDDGELAVSTPLIDPYGIVTDAATGQPIPGVKMSLYFADTALNSGHGHTPGTLVPLPLLPSFAPNQNAVPQLTTVGGQYAWLVFPDSDYYIVAEKDGYVTFDSRQEGRTEPVKPGEDSYITAGVIHVGTSIVHFDLSLKPTGGTIPAGPGGTIPAGPGGTVPAGPGSPTPAGPGSVTPAGPGGTPGVQPEHEHRKYIAGYPDHTFGPARPISRAEVATILYRILEMTRVTPTQQPYPDVAVAHWAAGYIQQVTAAGLMKGYPDGNFRPEAPITRAEVAAVAARFKQLQPLARSPFGDVGDHWAMGVIAATANAGIVKGYPDGTFHPDSPMTRAEFVTVVNRLLGRGPLSGVAQTWGDVPTDHWAFGNVEEASTSHFFTQNPSNETWTRASALDVWR